MSDKVVVGQAKSGIGFLGLLTLVLTGLFVAGKIFGYLNWSWWMVFLPAMIYVGIPIAITAIGLSLLVVLGALGGLFFLGLFAYKHFRRKIRSRRERKASQAT